LILKLLTTLKVPTEIILNQADLGKKELIEELAAETQIPISYQIPYSQKLVKAYSEGKLGEVDILCR